MKFIFIAVIIAFFTGCSVSDYQRVARIAASSNPAEAAKGFAIDKGVRYATDPQAISRDITNLQNNFKQVLALFLGEVVKEWGKDNAVAPSKTVYVKYTQNYKSRAEVDFDKGFVRVETVDEQNPKESLKKAIVTTLLTPDDPRGVDLYSAKDIKVEGRPFLAGLVVDEEGKVILYEWRAKKYADYLMKSALKSDTIDVEGKKVKREYVVFDMIKGRDNVSANRYKSLVKEFSAKYGIEEALVYAIIKTESAFNPYAVSSAPAYGLMQIVPSTAGRDVYRRLHGRDGIPSKDELFNPRINIEYGSAYINILDKNYLSDVRNRVSREYCVISAYNGGAGNVFKTFGRDKGSAINSINSQEPQTVFRKLRNDHPYEESRNYIYKVTNYKKEFVRY